MLKLWDRYNRWLETCNREVYALYCLVMGFLLGVIASSCIWAVLISVWITR